MALVLSLSEGQDFYAGDDQVVMGRPISSGGFFVLFNGVNHAVTMHNWVTIKPGVELRASKKEGRQPGHRIQINAPTMMVLKGTLYRNSKKANHEAH